VNAELGRKILDHVAAHPGDPGVCERALAVSGWEAAGGSAFRRPDGTETDDGGVITGEALRLLGLSEGEFRRRKPGSLDGDEEDRRAVVSLFSVSDDEAAAWLRELVEAAEGEARRA
jgi:hypothetical protein